MRGKLSNYQARRGYINQDKKILSVRDESIPLETQSRQNFEQRNANIQHARELMADKKEVERLNKEEPLKKFEYLISDKMNRKGMTREEALLDIIKTASKTR